MSSKYICKTCNHDFKQKTHYENHQKNKIPCEMKKSGKTFVELINEKIDSVISKKIKETDKTIIITKKNTSTTVSDDCDYSDILDDDNKKDKKKKEKKDKKEKTAKTTKTAKTNKEEQDIDLSYLRLPENEIIFEMKTNDNKTKLKSKVDILSKIDAGHQLLYNAENIEGEDALSDIMNFIFIKCIQPLLSNKKEDGKIDLLNKKYYKHLYENDELDEILSYFQDLSILADTELDKIRNMNEGNDAIRKMGEILKTHPLTQQIYTENNFIKAKKSPTIQGLLNQVICKINIKDLEENEDVIGEIYEHIINGYLKKGSKLGQYFTPRKLMKLISQYKYKKIDEIIKNIKGDIKLYDSCLGTGGWMVSGYNLLKEKYKDRILISGGEVKPSTFQYGLMNLILTLKKFPHDVQCESSLTHINKLKHHFIWTNPPFQTDKKFVEVKTNFVDDRFTKDNKIKLNDVYTLQDNNPPIQFLELNFYKLEENGLCFIVLPYGELFFGASYKEDRKHFMKQMNITDIILFESGIFTHTGIKTCVLIFEKDNNGTKQINFLKANKECSNITKITTVTIEDIEKEQYMSWYLRDYLKDEYIEELCTKMSNFEWVEFKDVFTLEKGKLQSSKIEEDENGDGVFINLCKTSKFKKIKNYNLDGENVFISNTMPLGLIQYFNGKCSHSDLLCRLIINDKYKKKINLKYIYYFLQSIKEHIETIYDKGACNKSLDQKNFNRMKIPIPTIEEQEKIIIDIMELENIKENNIKAKEGNERMRIMYMEAMIKGATNKGINKIMRLSEILNIDYGKRITEDKDGDINGLYDVYGGGDKSYKTNNYNREGKTCKISRFGISEKTCVMILNDKYYLNDAGLTVETNNPNIITNEYLWNYLILIKKSIYNTNRGTAQAGLGVELFKNFKIPIPPIQYQKQMEETINMIDFLQKACDDRIINVNDNIKTAFMNSLDSYGNPNAFNLDKLIFDNEMPLEEKEKEKEINKADKKIKSSHNTN